MRALMYYALKVWSDIAPLNFHEVAGSDADIQIDFTKADHDDGYPFDGPGGTVAHAFFPGERFTAGDTHFDDDEAWTFRSPGEPGCVFVCGCGHMCACVCACCLFSMFHISTAGCVYTSNTSYNIFV